MPPTTRWWETLACEFAIAAMALLRMLSLPIPCCSVAAWRRYFKEEGKVKAATLSLSVLVAIEMFNALNALSEDASLFHLPPWANPWLIVAVVVSFGLHLMIMYIPFLANIFHISTLNWGEWQLVLMWSLPVLLVEEGIKFYVRNRSAKKLKTE